MRMSSGCMKRMTSCFLFNEIPKYSQNAGLTYSIDPSAVRDQTYSLNSSRRTSNGCIDLGRAFVSDLVCDAKIAQSQVAQIVANSCQRYASVRAMRGVMMAEMSSRKLNENA